MLSNAVRKILTQARSGMVNVLAQRTCAADINALAAVDSVLLDDAEEFKDASVEGPPNISFVDGPATERGDVMNRDLVTHGPASESMPPSTVHAVPGDHEDPADELEHLRRQHEQDSKIIEGLQRELERERDKREQ